jgi:hypothetical protein
VIAGTPPFRHFVSLCLLRWVGASLHIASRDMTAGNGTLALDDPLRCAGRRGMRLSRFDRAYRRYILALTSCAPELEDLADSFPALLFALISGFADDAKRERAFNLVCQGSSLRQAADAIGLAWWLRKLPAEAFTEPLPQFPSDPEFSLRISSLLPPNANRAAAWLQRVCQAWQTAGREYALWIARQPDLVNPPEDFFTVLAAWAWFSGQPGLLGHRLLRRPWTTDMSFRRAREELATWRQRLRLIECLGPGIETPWLADGIAFGFSFVALRTVDDFITESEVLENCLDQYADQLHGGRTAVFSIRKGTRRVACVEIGLHEEEVTMPTVVQLRALRNRRAPPEVWQATFAWLGGQRLEPLTPERQLPKPVKRLAARRELWKPYLQHVHGTCQEQAIRRAILHSARARRGDYDRLLRRPPAALRPSLDYLHRQRAAAAQFAAANAGEEG